MPEELNFLSYIHYTDLILTQISCKRLHNLSFTLYFA